MEDALCPFFPFAPAFEKVCARSPPLPHLGCSSLCWHTLYNRCILHRASCPAVGVEGVKGAQVSKSHQNDGQWLVDHHGCGGIGQTAEAGGKVPDTAQQRACCAAHQHQSLRAGRKRRESRAWRKERNIHIVSMKLNIGSNYILPLPYILQLIYWNWGETYLLCIYYTVLLMGWTMQNHWIHLCGVHAPISGKDMGRNRVKKVDQPNEAETQQQLGSPLGPLNVPHSRRHTPQSLKVERAEEERWPHVDGAQPHPHPHQELTPFFGCVQL